MSHERKINRRSFEKLFGSVGILFLASCAPKFAPTQENTGIPPSRTPTIPLNPTGTPAPSDTPTFTDTPPSTATPALTPECKPLGLTDQTKEFLASHEVSKGDASRNVILMTYDDTGSHENIQKILETYKHFGVKTTFFLPGGYSRDGISLKNYAAEIERIVSEGHVLGCHGLIHNDKDLLINESSNQIRKDIEQWLKIVKEIVPRYQVRWFRFPFGDGSERTRKVFAEYGLQSILWSLESGGMDKGTYPRVINKVSAGEIVLSHSTRYYDAYYAHSIIENLLSRGFSLESVETGLKPEDYLPSNLNPESCRQ